MLEHKNTSRTCKAIFWAHQKEVIHVLVYIHNQQKIVDSCKSLASIYKISQRSELCLWKYNMDYAKRNRNTRITSFQHLRNYIYHKKEPMTNTKLTNAPYQLPRIWPASISYFSLTNTRGLFISCK
jgi:hypothetical protein